MKKTTNQQCCATLQPAGDAMLRSAASGADGLKQCCGLALLKLNIVPKIDNLWKEQNKENWQFVAKICSPVIKEK